MSASPSSPSASTSLDSGILDQLSSPGASEFLAICDQLRFRGITSATKAPNIIVVGSRFSGKSSILEAISHVSFPVEGGTDIPTEVVLRPSTTANVKVSVHFFDRSKPPHVLERFDFKPSDLPSIVEEAKLCMGIPLVDQLSRDTLRLDIHGPGLQPLNLIDLPRLPCSRAAQPDCPPDVVQGLAESYMQRENSIIIIAGDALTQPANLGALTLAKTFDPSGERTIGVITKPDLTAPGSQAEADAVRVAQNIESATHLPHGWHVLLNNAGRDTSLEQRDVLEDRFFRSGAWATVPLSGRGAPALRQRLSQLMLTRRQKMLPAVMKSIENKQGQIQGELTRLGPPRRTRAEKMSFLLKMAEDYQRLTADGVSGWYRDPFFGDLDNADFKLRAQLRNFNHAFDYVMKTKGSTTVMEVDDEVEDDIFIQLPADLESFFQYHQYPFQKSKSVERSNMYRDLRSRVSKNKGTEFPGSPNQALVIALFREQARSWPAIAKHHVDLVSKTSRKFVDAALDHVVANPDVAEEIKSLFVDTFFEEQSVILRQKVSELWAPYNECVSLPVDVNLVDAASRLSLQGHLHQFSSYLLSTGKDKGPQWCVGEFLGSDAGDNDEYGLDQIYCMMSGYYESSRRTFTDNVINLAVESCLVRNIPGILTPSKVFNLDEEQLDLLASESDATVSRRRVLSDEQDALRKLSKQCAKLKPHRNKANTPDPVSSDALAVRGGPSPAPS